MQFFDHKTWSVALREPDWYLALGGELDDLRQRWNNPNDFHADQIKREVREFIETKLLAGEITLANTGANMDLQRQPIDTVVIHHTSSKPGYTLARMNAVHLLNLYVPYYTSPPLEEDKYIKGSAIWSGHHDSAGLQVFYAYHWLVRMDGTVERLLPDGAIGWQAGNWDVNKRSVAICLDNDYTSSNPSSEVLQAIGNIIDLHYPNVRPERIMGHREAAKVATVCPGNLFENGWKSDLIRQLKP